jgi:tocopherol O-methyltransferase
MDLHDKIAHFYDRSTPLWLDMWGEHMHHGHYGPDGKAVKDHRQAQIDLVEKMLEWGGVSRARVVLDAGCGVGGSARYLALKFEASVLGVTLSAVQADRAAAYNRQAGLDANVRIEQRDMMTLTEADGPFDLIWSMESAEHIAEKQHMFELFHRLLAPGGTLLMATWCRRPEALGPKASTQRLLDHICRLYHLPPMVSRPDLETMARSAGFSGLRSDDWSAAVSPFWRAVIRSALSGRGIRGLLKAGLPTIRGAWAMRYMTRGFRRGILEFAVLRGTK